MSLDKDYRAWVENIKRQYKQSPKKRPLQVIFYVWHGVCIVKSEA